MCLLTNMTTIGYWRKYEQVVKLQINDVTDTIDNATNNYISFDTTVLEVTRLPNFNRIIEKYCEVYQVGQQIKGVQINYYTNYEGAYWSCENHTNDDYQVLRYWPNGNLKKMSTYMYRHTDVKHGQSKTYYVNGNPESQTHYCSNNVVEQKLYYENGNLKCICHYLDRKNDFQNNILNGYFASFWENGNRKKETNYIDNQIHGTLREWHKNGKLKSYGYYSSNIPAGCHKNYHNNGKIKSIQNYLDFLGNYRHGPQRYYNREGKRIKIEFYIRDVLYIPNNKNSFHEYQNFWKDELNSIKNMMLQEEASRREKQTAKTVKLTRPEPVSSRNNSGTNPRRSRRIRKLAPLL